MAVDSQVESLIIACIDWFKVEPVRMKYCWETIPGKSVLTKRILARDMGYETDYSTEQCDNAIAAIKEGDLTACKDAISKVRMNLRSSMLAVKTYGGDEYTKYLDRFIRILHTDLTTDLAKEKLRALWFDLTHYWRRKQAKGVPTIPDLSQFMLIESIATLVVVLLGIVLPMIRPQTTGIYMAAPIALFAVMCVSNVAAALTKTNAMRQLLYWVSVGIGLIPVVHLQHEMSRWILWSWGGGVIVGVLIGNDLALRRSRRMANKYGPFACLWARHVKKNTYEFLMVRTDGTVAWRYLANRWYKHMDPLLGANLAICYLGALKKFGYETHPLGGWFPCYPALVATRMIGMRRRNPDRWPEARHSTADLSDELMQEFFARTPSAATPPSDVLKFPAVTLPKRKAIPW